MTLVNKKNFDFLKVRMIITFFSMRWNNNKSVLSKLKVIFNYFKNIIVMKHF